ncbi:MAG: hypothetical protein H8F28_20875 [Fibrella sp.]|nr:hypothetical protein [Armatimonadota bacterium]
MFKRPTKWCAMLLATVALTGMIGCGGGDTGSTNDSPSVNITRSTEATFSESARILAAREAAANGATWLNADSARAFDAELSVVRRSFPQVNDITALSEYDLRTVLVAVQFGTSWIPNWETGNVTTGEEALDNLLREFAPEEIQSLGNPIKSRPAYFQLRFGQSLNMVKLAERLKAASLNVVVADPNYTAGDGNNIKRMSGSGGGSHRYVFSRGSGDCPAGCINRYAYEFAMSQDGKTATLIKEEDQSVP